MTTAVSWARGTVLRQVKADLAWFPGRLAMSWRIGALCALMAMIAMLYGIPESAISCYLILFIMKQDAVESMVMAIAVSLLVSLVVGVLLLMLPSTLESAPLRMAVLIVSSFAFLWLGSASKLGPVGGIIALVIAFVMSLLGDVPNGEVATRAVLYAWLMAVSPMMLLVIFNLFMGRASWRVLRASLSERLTIAADTLRHPNPTNLNKINALLLQGQNEHQQRALLIRVFHLRPAVEAVWLESAVKSSYWLLLAISALSASTPASTRLELADLCRAASQAISEGRSVETSTVTLRNDSCEIYNALLALAQPDNTVDPSAPKASFFIEDAFTSPVHHYFALKTTAASVICYLIYTALDWQDIHTAMITCYVAAQGTTGETVHKLALRIVGCLIGALAGVLSIIFIIPWMADIGQLMVLVFGALLLAAWVSSGNERIAYAGIQIGLAFLLTVLNGFGPSTDLAVALDRVLGILLGNLVVYVLFTRLWPVAIIDSVRKRIHSALTRLFTLATLPTDARLAAIREASSVEEEIAQAREALKLIPFEPPSLRPSHDEYRRQKDILNEIEKVCPLLFLPIEKSQCGVEGLRNLCVSADETNISEARRCVLETLSLSPVDRSVQQSIQRLEELMK